MSLRSSKKFRDGGISNRDGSVYDSSASNVWRSEENENGGELNGVVGVNRDGPSSPSPSPSRRADMLPEILGEIIQRVEATDDNWPHRKNVVACGFVCKGWRVVTEDVVASCSTQHAGAAKITFPSCLKKPGPRDLPLQCLIKRDKRCGTFYLYLSLSPPKLRTLKAELREVEAELVKNLACMKDTKLNLYCYDMSVTEAAELARRSIYHATFRDAASGGVVSVYHVGPNGWKKLSGDDVGELHYEYFPVEPTTEQEMTDAVVA